MPENPRVFLEIDIDGKDVGRAEFELFANVVPKTVENFRALCTGERGKGKKGSKLHFKGTPFHRIIPNFLCQGGDITNGDGTGGESIYGEKFADESFQLKHGGVGLLSMANAGKNTNGSQFCLTIKAAPHLDGKHVVFGRLVAGIHVMRLMEKCGSQEGKPTKKVMIRSCGQIKGEPSAKRARRLAEAPEGSPVEVQVLHIVRKHKGSRKPSSWRESTITCSQEEARDVVVDLRKKLDGLPPAQLRIKFEEFAKVHSDCGSAKRGGDLGQFGRGKMQRPFEEASFALQLGELSQIVSSDSGEHIILRIQ